jgi:hypothetical protein
MALFALSSPGEPRGGQGIAAAGLDDEARGPKVTEVAVKTPARQGTDKRSDGPRLRAEMLEDGPINRAQRSHARLRSAPAWSYLARRRLRLPEFKWDVE